MNDVPYTYDELDEILRGDGHNDFIGLSAIDGLIAALVAGPAFVPRDEWLPMVFAGHMPSTVEGSSSSRAAATIMARYAEVEQVLAERPLTYEPIFMHHLGQLVVGPWAIGFMIGLSTRRDEWIPILTSPTRVKMAPILASSEIGRPMLLPDMPDGEVAKIAADAPSQIGPAVVTVSCFHHAQRRPKKLASLLWPLRRRL